MELGAAQGYLPLLNQLRAGNFEGAAGLFKNKKKENAPYALSLSLEPGAKVHKASKYSSFDEAAPGSIAVIPVSGPMMSQDFCGSLGTQTLGRLMQEADSHPNIAGHVLVMDTPGGTVAGTENFSSIIGSTQKPCVAFVQGMMASAGYWAGSAANHVMMGGQTAMAGSIGTMLQYTDSSKADKKAGSVDKMVRADASSDKNEAYVQLLAGNEQPIKEQLLNPLNNVFLGAVQQNRAGKLPTGKNAENVLSGKVYLAADAVQFGLADSIGTFQDAVQLALAMASDPKNGPSNTPNSQTTMNLKAKFGALVAALKVTPESADTTALTDAHLEDLNTQLREQGQALTTATSALTARETELATATGALTTATTALSAKETELSAAATKITDLEAQVKVYGKQPGALGTNPLQPTSELETPITGPEAPQVVDSKAAHNRLAASYGL